METAVGGLRMAGSDGILVRLSWDSSVPEASGGGAKCAVWGTGGSWQRAVRFFPRCA